MSSAVEPILASSLWESESARASTTEQRLSTKCAAIDTMLHGGFDHGIITCISAEADSQARDLTQALLVSHFCGSNGANATVIDTGQAVDVRRLYQAMLAESSTNGALPAAEVKNALGRIKIMKPFDFEGLTEGINELRAVLEGRTPGEKPPRGTVGDSQDDGEEMLDEPTPPSPQPVRTEGEVSPTCKPGGGLLIIDNITQLAAPLLKTNHASGQALITSFMRSLAHLTKSHNLCTVIVNSTISTKTSNYKEESPSAFSSCAVRPALGKTWTYLVDVHLLVHRVPKAAKDGKAVYGGQRVDGAVEEASVVEVMQDRYNGRVGRWAACAVKEHGKLVNVF